MIKLLAAIESIAVASILALATYEKVLLIFAVSGSIFGAAALVWLATLAPKVNAIQDAQAKRIDRLPDPGD